DPISQGREGDPPALRDRLREGAHPRRNRPGIRRHARTHPSNRSQGTAPAPFAGARPPSPCTARRAVALEERLRGTTDRNVPMTSTREALQDFSFSKSIGDPLLIALA